MDLLKKIEQLAPFGRENPKPLFLLRDTTVHSLARFGKAQEHLKLKIASDDSRGTIDAVTFFVKGNIAKVAATLAPGSRANLLVHLERDTFSRGSPVRLRLVDIRMA